VYRSRLRWAECPSESYVRLIYASEVPRDESVRNSETRLLTDDEVPPRFYKNGF